MRVTNWGLFLLGVYLILGGLSSTLGMFYFLGQIVPLLAIAAGVLLIMETWRR